MIMMKRSIQGAASRSIHGLYYKRLTLSVDPWQIVRKIGCPDKFVQIVQSFHDGMHDQVIDSSESLHLSALLMAAYKGWLCACTIALLYLLLHDAADRLQGVRHGYPSPVQN